MNNVIFELAEVIKNPITEFTYKRSNDGNDNNYNDLFTICVKTYTDYYHTKPIYAKPANVNIKQIPLLGEHVLIFSTTNLSSNTNKWDPQFYYFPVLGLRSNINQNTMPGVLQEVNTEELDEQEKTFKQKNISLLQPYEGDVLIEGRWGNTIRLGSTHKTTSKYDINNNWSSGDTEGDPIIILRTNIDPVTGINVFSVENFDTDSSSIYLTSTQKLNSLKLHNTINQSTDNSVIDFNKSQFVAVADRIILKSKTDVVALDSNKSIELNSPLLSIGTKQDKDKEYGLHSTAVKELFDQFFYLLSLGGLKDSNGMPVTIDPTFTDKFFKLRNSLDNVKIRQDKGDE